MMQPEEKAAEQAQLTLLEGTGDTRRRSRRLIALVATGLATLALMAAGTLGAIHLFVVVPYQTAHLVDKDPFWRQVNADGMQFNSQKDFANAEFFLGARAKKDPGNPMPRLLLGRLYEFENRHNEAIVHYLQAQQLVEGSWYNRIAYRDFRNGMHGRLGSLYYESNEPEKALAELNAISDFNDTEMPEYLEALYHRLDDPTRADYRMNLARELRNQLKLGKAREELQAALKLSQDPQTHSEIVSLLATQMPSQVRELSPLVRYYSLAGQKHQDDDDLWQAAHYYEQALKEMPRFEWDHNELAIIYRQMQDYGKASRYAQEAARLNPNFYNPHLTLGDIALDQSRYPDAIAHFTRAQQIILSYPDSETPGTDANIENQLGYAYEQMDQKTQAMQHYRLALQKAGAGNDDTCECLEAEYDYAETALARLAEGKGAHPATGEGKTLSQK